MSIVYTSDCKGCSAAGEPSIKFTSECGKRRAIQHYVGPVEFDLEEIHTLGWCIVAVTKHVDEAVRFVATGRQP